MGDERQPIFPVVMAPLLLIAAVILFLVILTGAPRRQLHSCVTPDEALHNCGPAWVFPCEHSSSFSHFFLSFIFSLFYVSFTEM